VQGVLSYDFSSTNKLKFEFLHSGDDFRYDPDASNSLLNYQGEYKGRQAFFKEKIETVQDNIGDYNSTLLDLQSIVFLSNTAFLKTNISYYDQRDDEYRLWERISSKDISADHVYFDRRSNIRENKAVLNIKTFEVKTALDYQFTPFYETKSGISVKNIIYQQSFTDNRIIDNSNTTQHYPDTTYYYKKKEGLYFANELLDAESYKLSGYLENVLQLHNNFLINIGGRFDYFDLNKDLNISPRISLAYFSKFGSVLRAAWGEYYQAPIYRQLAYSVASDTNTQAQHATHYILGLEQNFSLSKSKLSTLKFKLDIYYKDYKDLISSYYATFDRLAYSRHNDSKGYAKGFDLYILLSIPNFYTWISYGYLEAKENNLTDKIGYYRRYTDQTHTLTWVADVSLGKGWGFNTRIAYGSGFPYTPRESYFDEEKDEFMWRRKEINSASLPDYKRVDLRISKNFRYKHFTLKTFIDISNILNFENIQGYEYKFDSIGKPRLQKVLLWPILPSFGIRFQF
jgi:outer membrane cobalamin receptor